MARALGRPTVAVLICILGLSLAPGASAAPVAAHWAMDETSGTTAFDDSGHGINATLTNVTLGQPGATGGSGDHSYLFDSTSKMVIPKALGGLTPGTLPVTITMQVRTSHRPGTGNFDFDMWSESGYQLEIYPRKGLAQARCKFKSSTQKIVIQDGPDLIDNQWHTIGCHKDSSGVSLIVDGRSFTHAGDMGALKPSGTGYVGIGSDGHDHYLGQMDDVTVEIG